MGLVSRVTGKFGSLPDTLPGKLTYVSFDPGITTGVTLWGDNGKPLHYNEIDVKNLYILLDDLEEYQRDTEWLKRIIVEEYRLYQFKALAQSGSHLETVQIIGAIKRSNYKMHLQPVVEVRADNKEIAAQWSGTKWNFKGKAHMPNWMASYLVGYWWLHSVAKIIPARVLEEA